MSCLGLFVALALMTPSLFGNLRSKGFKDAISEPRLGEKSNSISDSTSSKYGNKLDVIDNISVNVLFFLKESMIPQNGREIRSYQTLILGEYFN